MLFLFPHDYFDKKIPEDYYAAEHAFAMELGADVILIDFDAILAGSDPFPAIFAAQGEIAVWRGWQMTVGQYESFHANATAHGAVLVNSPEQYAACHELSGSYHLIGDGVIPTVFLDAAVADPDRVRHVFDEIGCDKLFVKDTVKGQRDFPCAIEYGDDDNTISSKLSALRSDHGDAFTGTFAFRKYMELSGETRFFILDDQVIGSGSHFSDSADVGVGDVIRCMGSLPSASRFFTIDMAIDAETGVPVVVETGDGQVSECPDEAMEDVISALAEL